MEGRRTRQGHPASRSDGSRVPSAGKAAQQQQPQHPAQRKTPPSGKGFLRRRKCPLWLRRKRATRSPEGQAACRSRLCMEAAHESPIQAVRKPSLGAEAHGWPPTEEEEEEEESACGAMGPSLLRKLPCLKAASSRLKKPPRGPGPSSPLAGASPRWRPLAALSRAADPQGESPLRWKATAGPQGAAPAPQAEVGLGAGSRPEEPGLRRKPWRWAFREAVASRARRRRSARAGPERPVEAGRDGGPTAGPGSSPSATSRARGVQGELPGRAGEGRTPLSAWPRSVGVAPGAHKDSSGGPARRGLQGPEAGRAAGEGASGPGDEAGSRIHAEKRALAKDAPMWACDLSGGNEEAAGGGRWAEGWVEEEPTLAELAKNPGGQGMLMGTRDLGWLHRELLGGATLQRAGETPGGTQDPTEEKLCPGKTGGMPAGKPAQVSPAGSFLTSSSHSGGDQSHGAALPLQEGSGGPPLEESGLLCPGSTQEEDPILPGGVPPAPTIPSRGTEPGWPEGLLRPVPVTFPALPGESQKQAQPKGKQLRPPTAAGRPAAPQAEQAGSEPDPHLLYRAAGEIVGAVIDAAAAQLVQKEEQGEEEQGEEEEEEAALGLSRHHL